MEAEDLIFDDCSERQVVEKFSKLFPNISVAILAQTFVIEPIPVFVSNKIKKRMS